MQKDLGYTSKIKNLSKSFALYDRYLRIQKNNGNIEHIEYITRKAISAFLTSLSIIPGIDIRSRVEGNQFQPCGIQYALKVTGNQIQVFGFQGVENGNKSQIQCAGIQLANKLKEDQVQLIGFEKLFTKARYQMQGWGYKN